MTRSSLSLPFDRRLLLKRNLRYIGVGAACAVINNLLIIGLTLAGLSVAAANVISLPPMILIGYGLHAAITFDVELSLAGLVRFSAGLTTALPLSIFVLVVLVDLFHVSIVVAAPTGTALVFVWTYIATHFALAKPLRG